MTVSKVVPLRRKKPFGAKRLTHSRDFDYIRQIRIGNFSYIIEKEKDYEFFVCKLALLVPTRGTKHVGLRTVSRGAGVSPRAAVNAAVYFFRETLLLLDSLKLKSHLPYVKPPRDYKPFVLY